MHLRRHYFRNINFKIIISALALVVSNTILVRPVTSTETLNTGFGEVKSGDSGSLTYGINIPKAPNTRRQ